MSRVAVIDSGVANLASVRSALTTLGATHFVTSDPSEVTAASHIVLPGVGHFGSGMANLRRRRLDEVVRQVDERGTPLLAVCLGMQLLADGSDESPGVEGLGLITGRLERLPSTVRVPHLGWNGVQAEEGSGIPSGTAAFANSFCLTQKPLGWDAAWTTHGIPFVSALSRGRTLACQFHPELSGAFGLELMRRWLVGASEDQAVELEGAEDLIAPSCGLRSAGEVARRIVPCLDVKDGRVVKGVRFQNLRDSGDPAAQAGEYQIQGADEIVVLDIGASPENRAIQLETIRDVRARLHTPLTVGGGVRSLADARALLQAGADKVSVNTAAVKDPPLVQQLAEEFGTQCVVIAIDARRSEQSWEALVNGGREPSGRDAIDWAREATRLGAGEILLTSWDRDGTRDGCDLKLLESMHAAVPVPVIASGGIGRRSHVVDAFRAGADAVLAASVFHDGDLTVADIKDFLADKGVVVRR